MTQIANASAVVSWTVLTKREARVLLARRVPRQHSEGFSLFRPTVRHATVKSAQESRWCANIAASSRCSSIVFSNVSCSKVCLGGEFALGAI